MKESTHAMPYRRAITAVTVLRSWCSVMACVRYIHIYQILVNCLYYVIDVVIEHSLHCAACANAKFCVLCVSVSNRHARKGKGRKLGSIYVRHCRVFINENQ